MSDVAESRREVPLNREAHPVCKLFPTLNERNSTYQDLLASVKAKGQLHPIVCNKSGDVLDGRHRLRACLELGIEPRFIELEALGLGVSEADYAFAANFDRRDLTPDQRVQILAAYEACIPQATGMRSGGEGGEVAATSQGVETNHSSAEARDVLANKVNAGSVRNVPRGKTRDRLAKRAKVSTDKARQAIKVQKADQAIAKQVINGQLPLIEAERIVDATKQRTSTGKHEARRRVTGLSMSAVMQLLRDMSNPHAINDAKRVKHAARELAARADLLHDRIADPVRMLEELGRSDPKPELVALIAEALRGELQAFAAELAECKLS
ncbi:MAG TPA: ParB N-terminal domain-containing protein [Caldimonas sp.]|jgi:hypothetical protein|nr:ParB N-terminal domain-containing protein [Caldimonas sp.]HEX2541234.1 ParB N-terminal domain-containing protein [Caldimonas sp.]